MFELAFAEDALSDGDDKRRFRFRVRSWAMAAIRTQVVFDAAEPHALAAFWAEALHYEHEDLDAFVSGLVDAGHVPVEYTIEIERRTTLAVRRLPAPPR